MGKDDHHATGLFIAAMASSPSQLAFACLESAWMLPKIIIWYVVFGGTIIPPPKSCDNTHDSSYSLYNSNTNLDCLIF